MRGEPFTVSVLASGSGTNFQALLDRMQAEPSCPFHIGLLLASRPGIGAMARAERAGVPTAVLELEREEAFLRERLEQSGTDLVVLAGYLRLVPARVVADYWGRMINIHPALLPAFGGEGMYGLRVHRAVIESGVRVTGVTVHFVDPRFDRGPIIAQWPVPVMKSDDPDALASRVLEVEHELLAAVVEKLATGEVRLDEDGGCRWRGDWLTSQRFISAEGKDPLAQGGQRCP